MDDLRWARINRVFDLLLDGTSLAEAMASEPDPEIQKAVQDLWRHHLRAGAEDYLGNPLEFEVTPMFQPGTRLAARFRVERQIGSGGMGEVYLAWDERMECQVALKTIARLLAPSGAIRRRFLAEVRHARQVTHPNVCRIHELFESDDTAFFSMEYVDGVPLPEICSEMSEAQRYSVVFQMADGLHAAHRQGVVHGDFKPSNVLIMRAQEHDEMRAVIMDFGLARAVDSAVAPLPEGLSVRAGTAEYMAPELADGQAPTILSDIFAFGQVGRELMPNQRVWDECTKPEPGERPQTLEIVQSKLRPKSTRRHWLGGFGIAAATMAGYAIWQRSDVRVTLPPNARLWVNGFRAETDQAAGARLARLMVIASLRQSSRVRTIDDQDLLGAMRLSAQTGVPPLSRAVLNRIGLLIRADFWVEGELRRAQRGYSLDARILDSRRQSQVAASLFGDTGSLITLAESVALWLRKSAGESEQSLSANPGAFARFTSTVPEAVQYYFQALDYRNADEMSLSVPALREAIRLDPDFAQAHLMLGLSINSLRRVEDGFPEIETAHKLSTRLPERERLPIEISYRRNVEDLTGTIELTRQAIANYPDEPRYRSDLGKSLALCGRTDEAADALRGAMNLSPTDTSVIKAYGDALLESGRFDQGLAEFQNGLTRMPVYKWLYEGIGSAYWCMEKYPEALNAYAQAPAGADTSADVASVRIMRGEFDVAMAETSSRLAAATNLAEKHHANEFLCGMEFTMGWLVEARARASAMSDLEASPGMRRWISTAASWARRTGEEEALFQLRESANRIASRWRNAYTEGLAMHVEGLRQWHEGNREEAFKVLLQSVGSAFDMETLYDLAELSTDLRRWDVAENYWEQFEARRGTLIVRGLFPGLVPLAWTLRAVTAQARNDKKAAAAWSRKTIEHWSKISPAPEAVRTAAKVYQETRIY